MTDAEILADYEDLEPDGLRAALACAAVATRVRQTLPPAA